MANLRGQMMNDEPTPPELILLPPFFCQSCLGIARGSVNGTEDYWQKNEGRRMIHFLPPMFLPVLSAESVMEWEVDDPLPSCHGNDQMQPFFCPHSPANPALESQESDRTQRRDHWQENEGRRIHPLFCHPCFCQPKRLSRSWRGKWTRASALLAAPAYLALDCW